MPKVKSDKVRDMNKDQGPRGQSRDMQGWTALRLGGQRAQGFTVTLAEGGRA